MNESNNQSKAVKNVLARLKFVILIVDDNKNFVDHLCDFFEQFASQYYDITFVVESDVEGGMRQLEAAIKNRSPFDVVLLDYVLPKKPRAPLEKDLTLASFCTIHYGECCRWVAQLSVFPGDPQLIKLWEDFNLKELSVRLLEKSPANLEKLADAIFFQEIKGPLRSSWLPAELGAVETVVNMGRPAHFPVGFNVFRFIQRLGDVWPRLDHESRARAMRLFSIDPGRTESDHPKRIGFKAFTHDSAGA